ncbi:hypothetical protein [Bradyrhizobium sp.]|uniref:hypothetical protein n=1 Tax=Bradyrhizobium sp. TaxID=376 RepID=UPI003C704BAE
MITRNNAARPNASRNIAAKAHAGCRYQKAAMTIAMHVAADPTIKAPTSNGRMINAKMTWAMLMIHRPTKLTT